MALWGSGVRIPSAPFLPLSKSSNGFRYNTMAAVWCNRGAAGAVFRDSENGYCHRNPDCRRSGIRLRSVKVQRFQHVLASRQYRDRRRAASDRWIALGWRIIPRVARAVVSVEHLRMQKDPRLRDGKILLSEEPLVLETP